MSTNTEYKKQLEEVRKKVGPLGMGCQDSN